MTWFPELIIFPHSLPIVGYSAAALNKFFLNLLL